jgi:hypothetical protein
VWTVPAVGADERPLRDVRPDALPAVRGRATAAPGGVALASFPLVVLIYVAHFLSIFWLDYLYGLGFALPQLLLERLV